MPWPSRGWRTGKAAAFDAFGIDTALALIESRSAVAANAEALSRALRDASGVPDLAGPIGERVDRIRQWREVELRARLEEAAAAGVDRAGAERLLAGAGAGT